MGAYGDLVFHVLSRHAPQLELLPICLSGEVPVTGGALGRKLNRLMLIAHARRRVASVIADVYHVLDGSFSYMIGNIPWQRTLVTVHDMIPALQCRGRFDTPAPGWAARRLIHKSVACIRDAGAVHAVSSHTAADVLEITGRAANAVLLNPLRALPVAAESGSSDMHDDTDQRPFILHVGNNSFYKNRAGVVSAFACLAAHFPALRLILAGTAPDDALRALVARHDMDTRITFVEYPDDRALARLYRKAALLLFPSIYEGFGWPPLEAMRYGCPVVCSNAASLPEVVGDAALMCSPDDPAVVAAACQRVLSEPLFAAELRARGVENLRRFEEKDLASGLVTLYTGLSPALLADAS